MCAAGYFGFSLHTCTHALKECPYSSIAIGQHASSAGKAHKHAYAGNRAQVTSMGGLYDTTTLYVQLLSRLASPPPRQKDVLSIHRTTRAETRTRVR